MNYKIDSGITFDLFTDDISSMNCRFEPGCRSCPTPVRIICSEFNTDITTSKRLSAIFILKNPSISVLKSITSPVIVYSLNVNTGVKTNWDIV